MSMFDGLVLGLATLFSLLLPIATVFMRDAVKKQRQAYIKELTSVLQSPCGSSDQNIIPSIEFVKFKYFINQPSTAGTKDISLSTWLFSSIPLVAILFLLSTFTFSCMLFILLPESSRDTTLLPQLARVTDASNNQSIAEWSWILIASCLGGYLFMLRGLVRAIRNFELSPLSFITSSVHLLFGVATAMIIIASAKTMLGEEVIGTGFAAWLAPGFLVTAFVVGYVPEFGLRALLRRSQLRDYKRDDPTVYDSFRATPVEVIDGIDSEVRHRLADYHIVAVQNLATANPILLFVETPYGIYQVMDWVAQAQLCCSVGPRCMTRLWKLGIRTIFDLEQVGTDDPRYSTTRLRQLVGQELFRDWDKAGAPVASGALGDNASSVPSRIDDAMIRANIQLRLDDPHIHRLRQIYKRVKERLGTENERINIANAAQRDAGQAPPHTFRNGASEQAQPH